MTPPPADPAPARDTTAAAPPGDDAAGAVLPVDLSRYQNPLSWRNKLGRALWHTAWWLLVRPSPRPLAGWRRFVLRCFGARIGAGARPDATARIWAPWNLEMGPHSWLGPQAECYCVAPIRLGPHAVVSQHAYLCAAGHDIRDPGFALAPAPITVEQGAWVAARAYVAPGVTVGEGAVVGACAVVTRDVAPWAVVAGNPARVVGTREVRTRARGHGRETTPAPAEAPAETKEATCHE